MRITGPGADVDDVESLVEEREKGGKLREGREWGLDVERVGRKGAWRRQGVEAELNVLKRGFLGSSLRGGIWELWKSGINKNRYGIQMVLLGIL